jgi:hypothetical protein
MRWVGWMRTHKHYVVARWAYLGGSVHEAQASGVIRLFKAMERGEPACMGARDQRIWFGEFWSSCGRKGAANALCEAFAIEPHHDPTSRQQAVVLLKVLDVFEP